MLEQLLLEAVKAFSEKTALVYDNLKISYKELYSHVSSLSKGLSSIGLGQGDCVALVLPNCPEFAIAFYSLAQLNGIVLPLNHLFKAEEISHYISDSNARAIITDMKRAELCRNVIAKLDKEIELIVVDGIHPFSRYFYELMIPEETEIYDPAASSFEGDLLYQYSSGSTGKPKKVCRTQYNLSQEVKNFTATAGITSADTILCTVPLYHAHGLGNCLLAATCNGATLVILEQVVQKGIPVEVPFVFRRTQVLELIEKEGITILPAVPYILNTLAETPSNIQVDLSTLRLCFSAGNFLSKDIFEKFFQRFGIPIRQLYGCTEAGSISINLDAEPEKTLDSVGIPMQNVEVKIIGEAGNELPIGAIGEVVIKSEALTSGYSNMRELNQQAFRGMLLYR
jgi:long-chain acyl-CoA synthetase